MHAQSSKLNAADLESLLPTGDSGEAASLLPKVMQLQSKVEQIEGWELCTCEMFTTSYLIVHFILLYL